MLVSEIVEGMGGGPDSRMANKFNSNHENTNDGKGSLHRH